MTKAFLIEARSIGGISGSPVFARQSLNIRGFLQTATNAPLTVTTYADRFYLVGLVSAHWDIDPADLNEPAPKFGSGVNIGLAIVTPAYQILEILEGPELSERRKGGVKKTLELQKERGTATLDQFLERTPSPNVTATGGNCHKPQRKTVDICACICNTGIGSD